MILLVHDRKNNLHLVNYISSIGNKYTVCGKIYFKRDIMNFLTLTTIALDNALHNICRTCYEDYETMYGDDLESDIRMAHSTLNQKLIGRSGSQAILMSHPEIKYWSLEKKHWDKLAKYQRKTSRK